MSSGGSPLVPLSAYLWNQLDDMDHQLDSGHREKEIASVLGTGVVAYVGYVLLKTRGGYFLLSLLTSRPLWTQFDPLAVMLDWEKSAQARTETPEADEEETLQSLIDEAREQARDESQQP